MAGVERNQKINKRVDLKIICRLAEDKVEKHISVSYNSGQLLRNLENKRTFGFGRNITSLFESCEPTAPAGEENRTDRVQIESTVKEIDQEFDFDLPLLI